MKLLTAILEFMKNLFKKPAEPLTVETPTPQPLEEPKEEIPKSPIKVLVDNGHGYDTPGKKSPYSYNKVLPELPFEEWEWAREISGPIVEELKSRGYDAELLVTEKNDVSLKERVKRVNKQCNEIGKDKVILISIHANAAGNGTAWMKARGWSAYTSKGKTKSDIISDFLYEAADTYLKGEKIRKDMSDGDPDYEENFYILRNTYCPAVLTENFFYDNIDDVKYILSDKGKKAVIDTHVEGIINYLNSLS